MDKQQVRNILELARSTTPGQSEKPYIALIQTDLPLDVRFYVGLLHTSLKFGNPNMAAEAGRWLEDRLRKGD